MSSENEEAAWKKAETSYKEWESHEWHCPICRDSHITLKHCNEGKELRERSINDLDVAQGLRG
jgi:hypothetical protein